MAARKLTYGEQLKHPNWQRKRLENLEAADWHCTKCESADNTLHVHHKRYVKGRMAWEYENDELEVLCDECHLGEHALRDLLDEMIAKSSGWGTLQRVVSHVGGLLAGSYDIPPELAKKAESVYKAGYSIGVVSNALSMTSCTNLLAFVKDAYSNRDIDPAMVGAVEIIEQINGSYQKVKGEDA